MGEFVLILLIYAADGRAAVVDHIYFANMFACERAKIAIRARFDFAECLETNREKP
jgi:hypothetical protein